MPNAKDSAFYEPPEYTAAEKLRRLPRMLMAGTDALRAEAAEWLPPYSEQEQMRPITGGQSDYDKRVSGAVVEPYYEDSVKRVVSTILAEPIVPGDDVPTEIAGTGDDEGDTEGWIENIDLRGNDINVFMRAVVEDAAGEGGMSTVLVEYPVTPEGFKLSDVNGEKLRPYWRHYRATDVLEAVPEYINGAECIKRLRLKDGCDEDGNEQVRILEAAPYNKATRARQGFVTWRVIAKVKKSEAKVGEAPGYDEVQTGSGTMEPHQEIPLAVLYFDYRGFFRARPPQIKLAHLNLKHTRQDCEIADDLSVSSGAQLHRAGVKDDEKNQRVIGKRMLLTSTDSSAKAEWLERSGTAAKVYMDYQERLEDKMRSLGNLPLVQRTGNLTATGQAIDTAQAKTEVQAQSIAVRDFTERLLTFTAIDITGVVTDAKGGSVDIKMPKQLIDKDPEGLRLLLESNKATGVPLPKTILERIKEQGLLPDDFDAEAEVAEMEANKPPPPAIGVAPGAGGDPKAAKLAKVKAAIAAAEAKLGGQMPMAEVPPS